MVIFYRRRAIKLSFTSDLHYNVNNKVFYNPHAAFLYAAHNCPHKHVTFNVFDSAFNKVDWKTYPNTSYETLFKMRATQIRNKYNKVGILFSGGTDSTTVLSSFLDNKILIDFIVVLDHSGDSNFKPFYNAKKLIQWIKDKWPEQSSLIKFIIYDFGKTDSYPSLFNAEESILDQVETKPVRFWQSYANDDIKKILDKEFLYDWKLITGHEVPHVSGNSAYFIDKTFLPIFNRDWIEFFFLSPEMPEITIKQSHDHAKFNKIISTEFENPSLPYSENASQYSLKKTMMGCKNEVIKNLSLNDKIVIVDYEHILFDTDFTNNKNIKLFELRVRKTLYGYYHNSNSLFTEIQNWYNGIASLASDKTLINYMVRHGYLNNNKQLPHNYNGIMSTQRSLL